MMMPVFMMSWQSVSSAKEKSKMFSGSIALH